MSSAAPNRHRLRLLLLLGAVAAGALAAYLLLIGEPPAAPADTDADTNAGRDAGAEPAEVAFGNLRWTYEGPAPLPVPTIGWDESSLHALIVRDQHAYVVTRAPVGGEPAYLLRPITPTEIGDAVTTHVGVLAQVLPGVPMPWVLSDEWMPVQVWELGADGSEEAAVPVFETAAEHQVLAKDFWVRGGEVAGGVLTSLPIYETSERPRREMSGDPGGGVGVRITGPRPIAVERWFTPVGGPGRPARTARDESPLTHEVLQALVVGSAAGAATLVFDRAKTGLRTYALEVIRFDARGRELWRRRTPLDGRVFEPLAALADDGILEAAWRTEGPTLAVVTLSEAAPQPVRTVDLEGDLLDHHPRLIRCGGRSYVFDLHSPNDDRIISRRSIEVAALGPADPIYRATLEHDGPAPTRRDDQGHHDWVEARNGAHLRIELACDGPTVAIALDVPTQPTTSDRGLVYLSLPAADP